MKKSLPQILSVAAVAGLLSLTLAACGGDSPAGGSSSPAASMGASVSVPPPLSPSPALPQASTPAPGAPGAAPQVSTPAPGAPGGAATGENACQQAIKVIAGAGGGTTTAGDPAAKAAALEKSGQDLLALANTAPEGEQKEAIKVMAQYYSDLAAAAKTMDSSKIAEITKAAATANSPVQKASLTLAQCGY